MSTPKPPKQLRITRKQQFQTVYHDDRTSTKTELPPLGFAIIHNPNLKSYAKSMKTQNDWAYCAQYGRDLPVERDGQFYIVSGAWEPKNGMTREEAHKVQDGFEYIKTETLAPYQPIIIDNEPLEGYRIQHMVSRERGNKVWRILDPRGFELEITSGTFEDIIFSGVVDRGLIVGPCIWMTGKQLVRV